MASRPRLGMAPGAAVLVVVCLVLLGAGSGPGAGSSRHQSARRRRRRDPPGPEHLSRPLRRVPRHRRQGLPRQRPDHRRLGPRRLGRPDRKTILTGVPGTEMPANPTLSEDEVWMLVAYLRTLSAPGGPAADRGDAARGEQLFWADGRRQLRPLPHGGRPRRPARPGAVAHRRLAVGDGARARDSPSRRGDPDRLRDRHRDHARRQEGARRCARTKTPSRCS